MSTVSDICDRLGRRRMAQALGVKPTAISNAVVAERFPAKWFLIVKEMCERDSLDCPESLFAFASNVSEQDRGAA